MLLSRASCAMCFRSCQPVQAVQLMQMAIYNVSPKNETPVILYNLYSCKSVAIARDILMTLATICIHNLPPHLNYVSTLPDITQKPKHGTDELKQRLIDTWDRIPQGIIEEASGKHGCVHV